MNVRALVSLVAVLLVGLAASAQTQTEPANEVVRPSGRAPHLYLRAVDPLGASVLDLRADEIRIREDGVEREVLDVRLANLPVNLTILVDNSPGGRATRGAGAQRLLHYRSGMAGLVDRLPPYQLVSILPLSGTPRWLLRASVDPREIQDGIEDLQFGREGLHLLDALDETTRAIEELGDPARSVVVIVAAVARERSELTQERYDRVVDRLLRHGVTVHAVVVTGQRTGSVGDDFVSRVCAQLTDLTGGHHRRVWRTNHVIDQLAETAGIIRARNRELSRQLLVRYGRPAGSPPAEEVGVEIARRNLRWDLTDDGRIR